MSEPSKGDASPAAVTTGSSQAAVAVGQPVQATPTYPTIILIYAPIRVGTGLRAAAKVVHFIGRNRASIEAFMRKPIDFLRFGCVAVAFKGAVTDRAVQQLEKFMSGEFPGVVVERAEDFDMETDEERSTRVTMDRFTPDLLALLESSSLLAPINQAPVEHLLFQVKGIEWIAYGLLEQSEHGHAMRSKLRDLLPDFIRKELPALEAAGQIADARNYGVAKMVEELSRHGRD